MMKKITLNAYAKVNLSLDVIRRRDDGYHELEMIMQQISLKDIITITETENSNIEIKCNNSEVPTDKTNISHKAAALISERYNKNTGILIEIEKNIPVSAGLAGGSTNAAAVLKGLNEIWNLSLTTDELMAIGLELGADVPFCIMGETALAEGIGEKLTPIKSFKNKKILLVNPGISVSTKDVYKSLNLDNIKDRPQTEFLIKAIESDDQYSLAKNMKNVLESVTIEQLPVIREIKEKMIEQGAIGSLMSGSGATVFGIFETHSQLEKCKTQMEKQFKSTIEVNTI